MNRVIQLFIKLQRANLIDIWLTPHDNSHSNNGAQRSDLIHHLQALTIVTVKHTNEEIQKAFRMDAAGPGSGVDVSQNIGHHLPASQFASQNHNTSGNALSSASHAPLSS